MFGFDSSFLHHWVGERMSCQIFRYFFLFSLDFLIQVDFLFMDLVHLD